MLETVAYKFDFNECQTIPQQKKKINKKLKRQVCLSNSSHLFKLYEQQDMAPLAIPTEIKLVNPQDGITKRENSTIQFLLSIKTKF